MKSLQSNSPLLYNNIKYNDHFYALLVEQEGIGEKNHYRENVFKLQKNPVSAGKECIFWKKCDFFLKKV